MDKFEQAVREMAARMTRHEIKVEVDRVYDQLTREMAAEVYGAPQDGPSHA